MKTINENVNNESKDNVNNVNNDNIVNNFNDGNDANKNDNNENNEMEESNILEEELSLSKHPFNSQIIDLSVISILKINIKLQTSYILNKVNNLSLNL